MTFVKTALFHKAGEGSGGGGGGGDQHNLGWYATEAALESAHPTASNGDWAIVGATDTVWVWDSDTTAWKDTGAAGIELPDQTGHSGEFLTTNGSSASWSDKPLVNATTVASSLTIKGNATSGANSINIGRMSNAAGSKAVSVGDNCTAQQRSVSIGGDVSNVYGDENITIGWTATQGYGAKRCIAIGVQARNEAGGSGSKGAIQIGTGVNTESGTACFALSTDGTNFTNYKLLDSDGTIPTARFTTDPSADGTYYPTLTISSGTPTRSWSTISGLQNTATGNNSLTVLGTAATSNYSVNIGSATSAGNTAGATVVGGKSKTTSGGQVFGYDNTVSGTAGVVVAQNSTATNECSCVFGGILNNATANYAIQIGGWGRTNSDANTLKVGNANGNFEIMSANGTIPTARLTKVNTTVTLAAADWSGGSQTVTVTGMTTTGVVLVSPDPTDQSAYTSAGIICTTQAADSLTFTCSTTPSADIDVNVVML